MSEELYKIVLKGYSTDKGEYYIEADFANLFKIEHEKVKELFSSLPTTIKENLSLEKANEINRCQRTIIAYIRKYCSLTPIYFKTKYVKSIIY